MSLTSFSDALQDKMKRNVSLKNQLDTSEAVEIAEGVFVELFGETMASHAKPLYLKNRTLTVSCTSTAMASEIRLNQAKIVEAVNKKLKKNDVDRIRYLS
ncbi:MAG: hypothetical protein COV60_00580 [Candidatus Magasanikbacteria bacterium CG11_big_fil_rev_8_21_14_0_20_43_7]|uniref:RNA-binding protein n=1 Tax=Candidatus Magasanikbacteria bacterium CG11_big_fil_rev_8_21_14_0_20_43_7 TaxID=1974654 RepID=A0A2H0N3B9_9BACT|nr:MAG: hypothetical protein COV60_00580 [Candidatus Magasanikbacteria bacterium CG11_big_fil_rev_8_21_14_0_20_43_7]